MLRTTENAHECAHGHGHGHGHGKGKSRNMVQRIDIPRVCAVRVEGRAHPGHPHVFVRSIRTQVQVSAGGRLACSGAAPLWGGDWMADV